MEAINENKCLGRSKPVKQATNPRFNAKSLESFNGKQKSTFNLEFISLYDGAKILQFIFPQP